MKSKSTAKILRIHATAMLALAFTFTVATAQTWNGAGSDDNWTTAENWGGSAPSPSTTTNLVFAGDTRTTTNNDFPENSDFGSITFDSAAGAFNLTGNPIKLIGNISINNNPASKITQTISLGLQLTGGRSIMARGNGLIQVDGDTSQDGTNRTLNIANYRVALNGANTFNTLVAWGGTAVISSLADNGLPSAAGTGNMRLGNGITAGNIEYTGGAVSMNKGDRQRYLFDLTEPGRETAADNRIAQHPEIATELERKLIAMADTWKTKGLPKEVVRPDQLLFDSHVDKKKLP